MRRKTLPDDHVRITVRVPRALLVACASVRGQPYLPGRTDISALVRWALEHAGHCPDFQRAAAETQRAWDARIQQVNAEVAAWEAQLAARYR